MEPPSSGPIPNAYWVKPGRFLAGDYPGGADDNRTRTRVHNLLAVGVTLFLDLTEVSEHRSKPYAHLLEAESGNLGQAIEYHRIPIRDWQVPTLEVMTHILDTIDTALDAGQVIYVHCFAGLGRTGTVVGCYLARHGLHGEAALAEIARLRHDLPTGKIASPEVEVQRQMVRRWPMGQ